MSHKEKTQRLHGETSWRNSYVQYNHKKRSWTLLYKIFELQRSGYKETPIERPFTAVATIYLKKKLNKTLKRVETSALDIELTYGEQVTTLFGVS